MITSFKNRNLVPLEPLRVYRCLNKKGKIYSIQQNNLVVAHCDSISLINVRFIIYEKGQLKVRESGVKNVHAFIHGYLNPNEFINIADVTDITQIKYDPFKYDGFVSVNDNKIVTSGKFLTIGENGIVLYK